MDVIISSRIRLARNFKKYPFPNRLSSNQACSMIQEARKAIVESPTVIAQEFDYIDLEQKSSLEKLVMMEKHLISPELVKKTNPTAVLVNKDESISIMVNEEDHLRIQGIQLGSNIDKTWEVTSRIDDLLEESIEYAFHEKYGYLTSCPTNVGTGLRASYMLHVPILEATGQLKMIVQAIGKFGFTIRGMYGEGTETQGSLYQISNQITLGQSEKEIIDTLKTVTTQIVQQEKNLREKIVKENRLQIEDQIYRSYGTLKYARQLSSKEAMKLLSDVKVGFELGMLEKERKVDNIYDLMVYTQPANLQKQIGRNISVEERDEERARYIRNHL